MRHRALAGASRARLLAVLRASREPLGIGHLTDAVGLHPNTVRAHIQQLLDADRLARVGPTPVGVGGRPHWGAFRPGPPDGGGAGARARISPS